jgi:hypothetical protein
MGQRLLAASPLPPDGIRVVTADCSALSDHTQGSINVVICVQTLAVLENEAELAFLLGHELCHAILRHGSEDEEIAKKQRDKEFWVFYMTGPFGAPIAEVNSLNENAARTRRQEQEADFCGLDLMERAGFNVNGALSLLDLVVKWSMLGAERQQRDQAKIDKARTAEAQVLEATRILSPHGPAILYQKYALNVQTHDEATERIQRLKSYMKANGLGSEPRDVGVLPWMGRASSGGMAKYVDRFRSKT